MNTHSNRLGDITYTVGHFFAGAGGAVNGYSRAIVFKRRAVPLSDAEMSARPVARLGDDRHIEFEGYV